MPALVAGIHVFPYAAAKTWMAGSSPAMTKLKASALDPLVLFRQQFAGAAEFGGEVLHLRQAVLHRQNRLAVIDVDGGRECQARDRRCVDVDQADRLVAGHQMAAAFAAAHAL